MLKLQGWKVKSQSGFSLIELMVVVAILGILATIAVPQVNKFMAKARRAEVKTSLASMYTAQKAFYTEYTTYYGVFPVIGYTPEGKVRYNLGFTNAGPAPSGIAAGTVTLITHKAYCESDGSTCEMLKEANDAGTLTGAIAADGSTFTAEARSKIILAKDIPDVWTINQNKQLVQTSDGINQVADVGGGAAAAGDDGAAAGDDGAAAAGN